MYIAVQKRKRDPRILLSENLELMLKRLREDKIPASIIHQDEKTKFVRHIQEYLP